jgi:hypothetical protein
MSDASASFQRSDRPRNSRKLFLIVIATATAEVSKISAQQNISSPVGRVLAQVALRIIGAVVTRSWPPDETFSVASINAVRTPRESALQKVQSVF